MSSYINTVQAMLRRDAKWSGRGPVLRGQQYMERFQQNMITMNSGCMHGARVSNSFGFFVEVENERNSNESRLNVVMPGLVDQAVLTVVASVESELNGKYYPTRDISKGMSFEYRQVGPGKVNVIRFNNSAAAWQLLDSAGNVMFEWSGGVVDVPAGSTWTADSGSGTVVTTSEVEGVPVFRQRVRPIKNFNEFICEAKEFREIVPFDFDIDTADFDPYWEMSLEPYDEAHKELVAISVVSTQAVTEDVWDENLRQFVAVTRSLSDSGGSPSTVVGASDVTHTYYEEVRCGWFVKTVEVFNKTITTYWDSENFYWPPVSELAAAGNIFFPVNAKACVSTVDACSEKDTEITYPIKYAVNLKIKEAYNDPCKVKIETVFKATVVEGDIVNEVMVPEAISHDGIIQDFKLAPTLHPDFSITELVSTHPSLDTPVTRTGSYPATNVTDWPATIIRTFVRPMRGGYLVTTKTYYKPA